MFYEVDKDALALLRVMKDYHEHHNPDTPFSEGTLLAPELAAEYTGLEPDTLRYERAVGYLVREGALVWDERVGTVPGVDFYRVTQQGLELLEQFQPPRSLIARSYSLRLLEEACSPKSASDAWYQGIKG